MTIISIVFHLEIKQGRRSKDLFMSLTKGGLVAPIFLINMSTSGINKNHQVTGYNGKKFLLKYFELGKFMPNHNLTWENPSLNEIS